MTRLIEKTADKSGGLLRIHRDERDIFDKILSDINDKRETDALIVLDESNYLASRGGFIFVGEEYEVDQTLDLLLKDLKQEMMPVIAKGLFSVQT